MATYTCEAGYDLQGPGTLTCGTDGAWDLQAPSCGMDKTIDMLIFLIVLSFKYFLGKYYFNF